MGILTFHRRGNNGSGMNPLTCTSPRMFPKTAGSGGILPDSFGQNFDASRRKVLPLTSKCELFRMLANFTTSITIYRSFFGQDNGRRSRTAPCNILCHKWSTLNYLRL